MGYFEIVGGKKLKGEIVPQGAKNEAASSNGCEGRPC
jgi:UDP-N-acetylglucosamine enolpyruvyl transferase